MTGRVVTISPPVGKPAAPSMLVNVPSLITAYYADTPDPSVRSQRVSFGTSRHRGSSFDMAFNEHHIPAISQPICLYRAKQSIDGPLFLGMDTHALSVPAHAKSSASKCSRTPWEMIGDVGPAARRHPSDLEGRAYANGASR